MMTQITDRIAASAYKRAQMAAFNQRHQGTGARVVLEDGLLYEARGQLLLVRDSQQVLCEEVLAPTSNQPYRDFAAVQLAYVLAHGDAVIGAFHRLCTQLAADLAAYRRTHPYLPHARDVLRGHSTPDQAAGDRAAAQLVAECRPYLPAIKRRQCPFITAKVQQVATGGSALVTVSAEGLFLLAVDGVLAAREPEAALAWGTLSDRALLPVRSEAAAKLTPAMYWAFCEATVTFRQVWQREVWQEALMNY